jgi:hypothetical protein
MFVTEPFSNSKRHNCSIKIKFSLSLFFREINLLNHFSFPLCTTVVIAIFFSKMSFLVARSRVRSEFDKNRNAEGSSVRGVCLDNYSHFRFKTTVLFLMNVYLADPARAGCAKFALA